MLNVFRNVHGKKTQSIETIKVFIVNTCVLLS